MSVQLVSPSSGQLKNYGLIILGAGYYDDVEIERGTSLRSHYGQEYMVTGRQEVLQEPRLEYWVYLTDLMNDDKYDTRPDPKFTTRPTVNNRLSSAFHLPIRVNIAYAEGVWMSVTPTDEALIVAALDFEGVDSVERSLQEHTLLVLFNTVISNLVLLPNNFAFSWGISGLFQSFQSSTSVFDPAANPSLFKSTLDVVESDKVEITREFSLKFQKIVQQEQRPNFISRLHRGRLNIIPWSVIESREFYNLFSHSFRSSYSSFLTETMTEHRAKTLSTFLPIALATGFSKVEPF
ncbi:hypothetical protein H4582DRAFT_2149461 [Lactarius indigo]|nr:hypothetical protein H4582DRAFT_2149461 [Lactarius indigo]